MLKLLKKISSGLLLLIFPLLLEAQRIEVTGTVTDADTGETLPGVNVSIKGTTTGSVTDINGRYQLNAEPGNYIVFSFVGMESKEILFDGSTREINASLQPQMEILQEFVMAVSAIARDRETPVAISTISAEVISEKLGSQEFPEILKSTPSVYATKDGGGFGDGRINLRGFDSNNLGVLINGVPVNDMENGRVYWSNWAGLSDVTQTMQVQRGMGASRLAISSVGGTINIVTQTTDPRKGGSIMYGFGHDGYQRRSITLSTGMMDNGWSITALGGRTTGQGFVDGTAFDGWSYFLNASKKVNDRHILSFTAFGAPQWHDQRWPRQLIQTYRDHPRGIRYNPSIGLYNGQQYATSSNVYHKPQLSLNHFWSVNPETTLSTALYASFSAGGGRRIVGERSDWFQFDRNTGLPTDATQLTPDGYLNLNYAIEQNAINSDGSRVVIANAVNQHDWYGMLSTLQHEAGNFRYTGGLDLRYYRGYHFQEISDLLGGTHYQDVTYSTDTVRSRNVNREPFSRLSKGDKIAYHDMGEVAWGGIFTQAEYVTDAYSAFISATLSNTAYRRSDYFVYFSEDSPMRKEFENISDELRNDANLAESQNDTIAYQEAMTQLNQIENMTAMESPVSDWIDFMAYSIKGGANYNINQNHNVFANAGYFTRAPFYRFAFVGFTNNLNPGAKNERVNSVELGYGFRSTLAAANVILYRTEWLDKSLVRNLGQNQIANISGLDALHQGIEIDFTIRPSRKMELTGMFSFGDWIWQDDLLAEIYDENQVLIDSVEVYAGGLKVGNSAQTTAALGLSYEVLQNLRISMDFNHYDRLYADFNVEDRGDIRFKGINSWQLPAYQLIDLGVRYRFKIAGLDASLTSNINNLLNTEVIRDATDGRTFDYDSATVYYGWGRTWTTSFKIRF
jgi:outer membrane cobalamin receptor